MLVRVKTSPNPVVMQFTPDGKLVATGSFTVTGRIVIGVQEFTREHEDGRRVPMAQNIYGPKTV